MPAKGWMGQELLFFHDRDTGENKTEFFVTNSKNCVI